MRLTLTGLIFRREILQKDLDALEKKGYITRNKQYFEITEQGSFPFLTGLAAGLPKEVFTNSECITFGPDYFGRGDLVAVKVSGDSMSGDSIHDGDVVIINISDLDVDENILALRVDQSEMTLKRVKMNHEEVELISSNPDYPNLCYAIDRVEIVGKYVGLVRKSN